MYYPKNTHYLVGLVAGLMMQSTAAGSSEVDVQQPHSDQPNFVVILADDLGWSDLGFLGSSIRTPNLDALAERGTFLSHYYVAPTCSPTRSMLMTGVSNQAAGVGTMAGLQRPNQLGKTEYGAQLHDGVVTIAEALQAQGYATMMSGKWHLAVEEDQYPNKRGFEKSFGLLGGGASHFADQRQIHVTEEVLYVENGEPVELPADFYSSISYTDKLIEYIDAAGDKPFFAYAAYTAPHDPLQVPDDWLDKYAGVFDEGPAVFKERRRQRLVDLGIIPDGITLPPAQNFPAWLDSYQAPWAEREEEERVEAARRMEIYASMVELLDQQIGRLLDHLSATGKLDNTYVVFFSDNGAAAATPLFYPNNTRDWLRDNYALETARMGTAGSFTTMGREWTNNSNTPFRLFKGTVGEGGVRSPLLISGPGVAPGTMHDVPVHVMDIAPTILELASINPASKPLYDGKLLPRGKSITPLIKDGEEPGKRMLVTELFGNRMVRNGKWKAVFLGPPVGSSEWELFDIVADPSATTNVAAEHPDVLETMIAAYADFAETNNLVVPDPPMTLRLEAFYEGECNWWCELKFTAVNMLVN